MPASPAPERFSAAGSRTQSHAADAAGQAGMMDSLASDLSSLRREISEERKHRMELQERLAECLNASKAERQSFSAASADLQRSLDAVDDRTKADSRLVAQLAEKVDGIAADVLELASDASETQNSMHMVMDMLEGCVDGKEARELVAGCMERIEKSESAFKLLVEETVVNLTEHVDSAEQRTQETTLTAIEGIETMESRFDRHVADVDTNMQQLKQHAAESAASVATQSNSRMDSISTQTQEDMVALAERLNAHTRGLEESRIAADEQMAQATTDNQQAREALLARVEHQTCQLAEDVRLEGERAHSELSTAVSQLSQRSDSALGNAMSELQSQLDARVEELTGSVSSVHSSLTKNINAKEEKIQLVIGKVGADSEASAAALKSQMEHIAAILAEARSRIETEARDGNAAGSALDEKYADVCDQLRTLLTHMDADHAAQLERVAVQAQEEYAQLNQQCGLLQKDIASTKSDLIDASNDASAQLESLKENVGGVIDDVEAKFVQEMATQSEKFGELCLQLGRNIDDKVSALSSNTTSRFEKLDADSKAALTRTCESLNTRITEVQGSSKELLTTVRDSTTAELAAIRDDHGRSVGAASKALSDHATATEQALQRELQRTRTEVEQRSTAKLEAAINETHTLVAETVHTSRRDLDKVINEQSAIAQARSEELGVSGRARLDKERDALQQRVTQLSQAQDERVTEVLAEMRTDRETFRVTLAGRITDTTESITRATDAKVQRLETAITASEQNLTRKHGEMETMVSTTGQTVRDQVEEKSRTAAEANKRAVDQAAKQSLQVSARMDAILKDHATLKSATTARIEAVAGDIVMMSQEYADANTRLQDQMTQSMEQTSVACRKQVDEVAQHSEQQLREVSESFTSQLAQVEDEAHAVHTSKYTDLETRLGDLADSHDDNQKQNARTDDRLKAMHALQTLMHRADTHEVFRRFDLDRSGTINRREMQKGLAQIGMKVIDSELDELWSLLDDDDSGSIDYQEFSALGTMKAEVDSQVANLQAEARQHADALRAELGEYGATWQTDIASLNQQMVAHAEAASRTAADAQNISAALHDNLASAYERSDQVKTQLLTRINTEEAVVKQGIAALRDEAADLRADVSNADNAAIKLAARVSSAEDSITAGAESSRQLDEALHHAQGAAVDLSEKIERMAGESKRNGEKIVALEGRQESAKAELAQRLAIEERHREDLAGKVEMKIESTSTACSLNTDAIAAASNAATREVAEVKLELELRLQRLESKSSSAVTAIEALRVRHDGTHEVRYITH